jgi:hypothetical protein
MVIEYMSLGLSLSKNGPHIDIQLLKPQISGYKNIQLRDIFYDFGQNMSKKWG